MTERVFDGRRESVELLCARIEDAMTALKKKRPMSIEEKSHIKELAGWLEDLAGEAAGR